MFSRVPVCAIIVPLSTPDRGFYRRYSMTFSGVRRGRFYAFLFWVAFSTAAFAKDNPSYTQVGHNINVGSNDKVGDLTCFGCSIHVRGEVAGDVTAFGGSITLEDEAQVAGGATPVGGAARVERGVRGGRGAPF